MGKSPLSLIKLSTTVHFCSWHLLNSIDVGKYYGGQYEYMYGKWYWGQYKSLGQTGTNWYRLK